MDWLSRLNQEGRLESSGRFSVDARQARKKLALYAQAFPRQFLQNLLASAVLRGAHRFEVEHIRDLTVVRFDVGQESGSPDRAEMESILDILLSDNAEPQHRWLHRLALGALGASRESPLVTVSTPAGNQLPVAKSQWQVKPFPSISSSLVITVKESHRWARMLSDLRADDLAALEDCVYAPIDMRVDARDIREHWLIPGHKRTFVFGLGQTQIWSGPDLRQQTTANPFSYAYALGSGAAGTWLMVSGLRIKLRTKMPYNSVAIVLCDDAALDLTRMQLSEAEEARLLKPVLNSLDAALLELLEDERRSGWELLETSWPAARTNGTVWEGINRMGREGNSRALEFLDTHGDTPT